MRELRKEKNLTQEKLAHEAGLTTNGYAKIERAETNPKAESLRGIAKALGVSMEVLIPKIEQETAKSVVIIGENTGNTVNENAVIGIKNINCDHNEHKEQIELYKQLLAEKDKRITQLEAMVEILKNK